MEDIKEDEASEPSNDAKKTRKVRVGSGKAMERRYPCSHCSLVSHSSANLKKHMMTHSGERPYSCPTCHKKFRQKHHLADHQRVHTGERPFSCEVCGHRFVQKSSLNLHLKKHYDKPAYQCRECDSSFYERTNLVYHMRRHTGERPYQCEKCGDTFTQPSSLAFHAMIHTGEKKHQCEQCDRAFKDITSLQKHRAVHLKQGPFTCVQCNKEFPRLASLSLHRKVHTQKKGFIYAPSKEAEEVLKAAEAAHQHPSSETEEDTADYHTIPDGPSTNSSDARGISSVDDTENQITQQQSTDNENCDAIHKQRVEEDSINKQTSKDNNDTNKITLFQSKSKPVKASTKNSDPATTSSLSRLSDSIQQSTATIPIVPNSQTVLKESLARNLVEEGQGQGGVEPGQLRSALELGTVLETKDREGRDFFIILPPALRHKQITTVFGSSPNPAERQLSEETEPEGAIQEGNGSGSSSGNGAVHLDVKSTRELGDCTHSDISMAESEVESITIEYHDVEEDGYESLIEVDSQEELVKLDGKGTRCKLQMGKQAAWGEHHYGDGTSMLLWQGEVEDGSEMVYVIDADAEPLACTVTPQTLQPPVKFELKRLSEEERKDAGKEGKKTRRKKERTVSKGEGKRIRVMRVYKCMWCGKECRTSSSLDSHIRCHTGERPYMCQVCCMGFKQMAHLRSHMCTHTGERPYQCPKCPAAFTQTSRLKSHVRSHHEGAPRQPRRSKAPPVRQAKVRNFYCKFCRRTFINECYKVEHMRTHKVKKEWLSCELCDVKIRSQVQMQRHKQVVHVQHACVCEVCGHRFRNLACLANHQATCHSAIDKVPPTDGFITLKIGEQSDVVVVTPSAPGPGEGGSGDAQGTLRSAILLPRTRQSKKNKGKKCADEGVSTDIKEEPEEFVDVEGEDLQEKENSQKKNTDKKTNVTVKEDYSTYQDSSGRKVWKCEVCGKKFMQSSNLHSHRRLHTGERPYHCSMCTRRFRQITHLKDHMNVHTGYRPFQCTACGLCFSQQSAVNRHIRAIHQGRAKVTRVDPPKVEAAGATSSLTKGQRQGESSCSECKKPRKPTTMGDTGIRDTSPKSPVKQDPNDIASKPILCRICDQTFSNPLEMVSHLEICKQGGKSQSEKNPKEEEPDSVGGTGENYCHCKGSGGGKSVRQYRRRKKRRLEPSSDESSAESDVDSPCAVSKGETEMEIEECHDESETKTQQNCNVKQLNKSGLKGIKKEELQHVSQVTTGRRGGSAVCEVCGECFRRSSVLQYHMSMKHGRADRRYSDFTAFGVEEKIEKDLKKERKDNAVKQEVVSNDEDESMQEKMTEIEEEGNLASSSEMEWVIEEPDEGYQNTDENNKDKDPKRKPVKDKK